VTVRLLRPFGTLLISSAVVILPGNRNTTATYAQAERPRRPADADTPAPLVLEEKPQPLVPKQVRTEPEEDRLDALALFAAGRIREQRLDKAGALRLYQRALRRDPEAMTVARAIVPLAFDLGRHDQAVRYALKAVELDHADPRLLEQLGNYLTNQRDWEKAVHLYERVVAARTGKKETVGDVLLRMKMGRIYHVIDAYEKSADSFARVLRTTCSASVSCFPAGWMKRPPRSRRPTPSLRTRACWS